VFYPQTPTARASPPPTHHANGVSADAALSIQHVACGAPDKRHHELDRHGEARGAEGGGGGAASSARAPQQPAEEPAQESDQGEAAA
jgi:hypothetical protein